MKIEVERAAPFQPIKITLELETRDELLTLWHRLNIGKTTIQKTHDKHPSSQPMPEEWASTYHLWNQLDEFLREDEP
jgi:hypothetical protein